MKEKLEYEKFIILLELRRKIRQRLQDKRNKIIQETKKDRYSEELLEYIDQIINLSKELFNIDLTDDIDLLDNLIFENWPSILDGLKSGKYDYEWSLSSFNPDNDEIKENPNALKLYGALHLLNTEIESCYGWRRVSFESNPIYFLLRSLKEVDFSYSELYKQLIENNFYNPNRRDVEGSYHPFWTDNNNNKKLTELNKKIILDKRTNYKMDSNGSDMISVISSLYIDNDHPDNNDTYIELIDSVVRLNNCSIIEDYFDGYINYDTHLPLIYTLFENEIKRNELSGLHNLYKYCISEDGVLKQVKASTHPSPERNMAIDFYISLIEKDNPENTNGIAMLKQIKI